MSADFLAFLHSVVVREIAVYLFA